MDKKRVLFLCTGNSARSQMAEAFLRKHAGRHFNVFSTGIEPTQINPFTLKVLKEAGIDASNQYAKPLSIFVDEHFDYLITVCSQVDERCPFFQGMGIRLHWPFDDPAGFMGTNEEITGPFRIVRDLIQEKILHWLCQMEITPEDY